MPESPRSLPRQDSFLRCTVCGRTSTASFSSSLRTGWEKCCGYTMRLERTDADVGGALLETLQEKLDAQF